MLKNKKGISLTTMVMTVMVLLVIMGTLVYSALDSVKVRRLNKLYGDLRQLDDAVGIYYLKYGKLPVDEAQGTISIANDASNTNTKAAIESSKIGFVIKDFDKKSDTYTITTKTQIEDFVNPNDCEYSGTSFTKATYKYLKVDLLENVSLNYPDNKYIINTNSHTIYNFTGIKFDGKTYHTLPLNYKDTKYNETHPVTAIRLKGISGISEVVGSENLVYYSMNQSSINLKDLLIFDSGSANGLGEPKSVDFSYTNSSQTNVSKTTLGPQTGILSKKDGIDKNQFLQVTAKTTNYGDSTEKTLVFKIYFSSIDVMKSSAKVTNVNMLAKHTESTYTYQKSTSANDEYYIQPGGNIWTGKTLNVNIVSSNSAIANASYNSSGSKVIFNSEAKTGTTTIDFTATNYGLPKSSATVNVFDYKLYSGSGSSTNISKLDLTGIGDASKATVRFNLDTPSGVNPTYNVAWSIVKENGTTSDEGTYVTSSASGNQITITPTAVGKTYLKCTFSVGGEKLGESIIPITVQSAS